MVLSEATMEKSQVTPPGIDPGTVRLEAQRLNHYTTPGPFPLRYCADFLFIGHLSKVASLCSIRTHYTDAQIQTNAILSTQHTAMHMLCSHAPTPCCKRGSENVEVHLRKQTWN